MIRKPGHHRGGSPVAQRGFTLLELLVAMTLLGLIFVALTGTVRFGAAAWDRGAQALERTSELQRVHDLLSRLIGGARPVQLPDGRPVAIFSGQPETLHFVASAPAAAVRDGLYAYTVAVAPGDRRALTLSWQPVDADDSMAHAHTEVLAEGVLGIGLAYRGAGTGGDGNAWSDVWQDRPDLPALVRLTVRFPARDQRAWPDFVFAPKMTRRET